MENDVTESVLSTIALVDLLPPNKRPDRILAVCTEKSKKDSFDLLDENLQDIECEAVMIPTGKSKDELHVIIKNILDTVCGCDRLILDVTQGLRSIPFLFFTSALYFSALEDSKIEGAWYGMFEAKDKDGVAPFVDLSVLLDMIEWFYSVKTFTEERNAKPLAKQMQSVIDKMKPEKKDEFIDKRYLINLIDKVRKISYEFNNGLPIETGKSATQLVDIHGSRSEPVTIQEFIPLFEELISNIVSSTDEFRMFEPLRRKKGLKLLEEEINRQSRMIDTYLSLGQLKNASELLREFIISRICYEESVEDWLSYKVRLKIKNKITALVKILQKDGSDEILTENQYELAQYWNKIASIRNSLAHSGIKEDSIDVMNKKDELLSMWTNIKKKGERSSYWNLEYVKNTKELLISSHGLSKGLLFTAIKTVNPDVCFIITSKESEETLDEVIEKAGYGGDFYYEIIEDPHEISPDMTNDIIEKARTHLLDSEEVFCNITGGTTSMQWTVQKLGKKSREYGDKVHWVAMVDKRSMEEQKEDPYQKGEMIILD